MVSGKVFVPGSDILYMSVSSPVSKPLTVPASFVSSPSSCSVSVPGLSSALKFNAGPILFLGQGVVDEVYVLSKPLVSGSSQYAVSSFMRLGGQSFHAAASLSSYGIAVRCGLQIGAVLPLPIEVELEHAGFEVAISETSSTLRSLVFVAPEPVKGSSRYTSNRTIVTSQLPEPPFPPFSVSALLDRVSWVHMDGGSLSNRQFELFLPVLNAALRQGIKISLAYPSPRKLEFLVGLDTLLPRFDAIVARKDEFEAGKDVFSCSSDLVVFHNGPSEVSYVSSDLEVSLPVPKCDIDPLGAGDRFNAGVVAALSLGAAPLDVLRFGVHNAQSLRSSLT